jgi:hypothetical protein
VAVRYRPNDRPKLVAEHHARLIKTGDYQARSFTALEAAM